MITRDVSKEWVMLLNHYMTEIQPRHTKKEHYAGDECWCIPNRIFIKHSERPDWVLRVWVHAGDTMSHADDLKNAVDGVITYWDSVAHK